MFFYVNVKEVRKVRSRKGGKKLDKLLERLQRYKYDTDATYKFIAMACEIPFSTFYNFTSGVRNLKPKYAESLERFLKSRGY